MTTLFESPWYIIFFGIAAEAVLGIILVRTGRGILIWAMAGVLVLVLALVGLERLVVTDGERIEATLEGAAAALQANDSRRLLQGEEYFASSAVKTRARVRQGLSRVEFTNVRITNLEIKINRYTSPHTAKAHIRGTVQFKDRRGEVPYQSYPLKELTVELRRGPDRWLITGHEWHDDPRG